ncbi:uncharacterized protein PV09_05403 [Verruconis gallopava]|uniref:Major facilitator superfamily (MFS) profile domain-containing protein n=1 Tax=Verruconis gallopava TaxID=253628 RepID=A0A0D1XL91_9PEZI|nr:uncharacterized protein PV09_05403 [Verruconis gallopava]KIW03176.1 hypothetical protein PV09_05403 [Verruconis gallopava]
MTLTLAGDVVLGTLLTLVADKYGRRKILLGGSCLMVFSGAVFAYFENFWILLFAAVVGVISATGGDFGPFRSVEESILSHLTTPNMRSDVLSWYVTFSSLGSSLGAELSGRLVHYLQSRGDWTLKDAYHAMFFMYIAMGMLNCLLVLCLSKKCELLHLPLESEETLVEETEMMLASDSESDTLEGMEEEESNAAAKRRSPNGKPQSKLIAALTFFPRRLAEISPPTRSVMYKLWLLLALDSAADGMVPYTLTNYYMDEKFHLPKSTLGDITSVSYLLASFSTIFAAPLARRLGLVNTMVFTHVPSSTAVLLFPFPNSVILTVGLFFLRTGLNNMDQAPRAAFIAAVVKPEERTAVLGITAMLRTLASTAGPSITGILAGNKRFWIAFVVAGSFRLMYDFGLYALFINMRLHQHEDAQEDPGRAATATKPPDEEEGGEVELQKL